MLYLFYSATNIIGIYCTITKTVIPARMLLRNLYRDIKKKSSWISKIVLSKAAKSNLKWWIKIMQEWDGKSMFPTSVDVKIETDASDNE